MLKKILIALGILAVIFLSIFIYGYYRAYQPPDNRPLAVCKGDFTAGKKVVFCFGDSITHGTVSANYVDLLASQLDPDKYVLVNAGVISELAYNMRKRIGEAALCAPDYVTVLIGTNDANASLSLENADRAVSEMKLPPEPDKAWFRENLVKICRDLKKLPGARIALLSLPPIGEKLDDPALLRSIEYSAVIKGVAESEKVAYLPLNETMLAYLKAHPSKPAYGYDSNLKVMYIGIFKRFILKQRFDAISEANGFGLVTDFLHLNEKGAGMTADLIQRFIEKGGK